MSSYQSTFDEDAGTATTGSVISHGDRAFIRANIDWLVGIDVEAGETFVFEMLDIEKSQFQTLVRRGYVTKLGFDRVDNIHRWRLKPGVREAIDDAAADANWLPCGHRPFRNPRGMDGYTCLEDSCDAQYTKAEIREARE